MTASFISLSNHGGRSAVRSARGTHATPSLTVASVSVPRTVRTLVEGIRAERRVAERPLDGTIAEVIDLPEHALVEIVVDPASVTLADGTPTEIEDRFSGGMVLDHDERWRGRIEVVDVRRCRLVVDHDGQPAPRVGEGFRAFPFPFLAALEKWADDLPGLPPLFAGLDDADDALLQCGPVVFGALDAPDSARPSQLDALETSRRRVALIWGPPGTGKTWTLGAAVAAHLAAGRTVLAVGPTNAAVDLLTLAIDDGCKALGIDLAPGDVVRAGRPQNPDLMAEERAHLLRWPQVLAEYAGHIEQVDRQLVRVRRKLRRFSDDVGDDDPMRLELVATEAKLVASRRKLDQSRAEVLAELARRARCVVTTIHGYIANSLLHERPYDVTVVDEASMVPAAACCRLLADDRAGFVIGGDFVQLPPVCQSAAHSGAAAEWLGRSAFHVLGVDEPERRSAFLRSGVLAQLREQSRMHPDICEVVSRTFYDAGLVTVGDHPEILASPSWPSARIVLLDPRAVPLPDGVVVRDWAPGRVGQSNERTAAIARALMEALLRRNGPAERIVACAPYRAQARLLAQHAEQLDDSRLVAGTIHRTQGAEAHSVIFDPVQPAGWFLRDSDVAANLVNVAISRTQAQLFVIARPRELRRNPLLARLAAVAVPWVPHWDCLLGRRTLATAANM